jgi:hypothetical protein
VEEWSDFVVVGTEWLLFAGTIPSEREVFGWGEMSALSRECPQLKIEIWGIRFLRRFRIWATALLSFE